MGTLKKDIITIVDPGRVGIPAYNPPAAKPITYNGKTYQPTSSFGHWEIRTVSRQRITFQFVRDANFNETVSYPFTIQGGKIFLISATVETFRQPYWVAEFPRAAVPGIPSTTTLEYNLGWNSGAYSIDEVPENSSYQFQVPGGVSGVVTGINDAFNHQDPGYTNIDYGVYFTQGLYKVVENGAYKTGNATYLSADIFRIRRDGPEIIYSKNGSEFYRSTTLTTTNQTYLADASMFAGGDSVEQAAINANVFTSGSSTSQSSAKGTIQRQTAASATSRSNATAVPRIGNTLFMSASATSRSDALARAIGEDKAIGAATSASNATATGVATYMRSAGSFRPMRGLSSSEANFSYSEGFFRPLEGSAESQQVPQFAVSSGVMLGLDSFVEGLTGEVMSSAGSLPGLHGVNADYAYTYSETSMQPMTGEAAYLEPPDIAFAGALPTPRFSAHISRRVASGMYALLPQPIVTIHMGGIRAPLRSPGFSMSGQISNATIMRLRMEIGYA